MKKKRKKFVKIKKEHKIDKMKKGAKIMILGSGPYSIGSSVEFDWSSVQVLRTLRRLGFKTVFINSNPETVSTDFDECDRLYFEELTPERVLDVYTKEKPDAMIVCTGGQVAQNMIIELKAAGVNILGTKVEDIERCEDRGAFSAMCDKLEIDQPAWQAFKTKAEAIDFAKKVGFPVLVRPSFVLSGAAMAVANSDEALMSYLDSAIGQTEASVVISKFEENAKEIELDAVAINGEIVCQAIAEHVENAGVHSGDATIVLPPQTVYTETIRKVNQIGQKLAKELNITGPFNMQVLAKQNKVMIIECNLRASRSFPFASKVLRQNFMEIATKGLVGEKVLPDIVRLEDIKMVGVKAAQFSFSRLKGADPMLGVEMSSTGEVACFGQNIEEALLKSLISVGFRMPEKASEVLVTLGKVTDKADFLPIGKSLIEMGFKLIGTEGTSAFLQSEGVACETVFKVSDKHPNVLDAIEKQNVQLVVNTPNKYSHEERSDGYLIRRKAIDNNIPLVTNLQLLKVLVRAINQYPTEESLPVMAYGEHQLTS